MPLKAARCNECHELYCKECHDFNRCINCCNECSICSRFLERFYTLNAHFVVVTFAKNMILHSSVQYAAVSTVIFVILKFIKMSLHGVVVALEGVFQVCVFVGKKMRDRAIYYFNVI
jgi:hypothetical protein